MQVVNDLMASYAKMRTESPDYLELRQLLPSEDALNALHVDSKGAYLLHRSIQSIDELDLTAHSLDAGRSINRLRRVRADLTASEILSLAPFIYLMCSLRLQLVGATDPFVLHFSGLRRPALKLHTKRLNRRMRKDDHLSIADVCIFGTVWSNLTRRNSFLDFYRHYGSLHSVNRTVREQFASEVAEEVNRRLDALDQEAFGGLVPYPPQVFNRITTLFDRIGLELVVVWDALEEFIPDDEGSHHQVYADTGLLAYG